MSAPVADDMKQTLILSPSYRIPMALGAIALGLGFLNPWAALPLGLFAIFLSIQAATLRLHFTAVALELYRGEQQLRYFPYEQWQNWRIYWNPVPILFYFKEIRSIHFVPILFNPLQLQDALNQYVPQEKVAALE